ncbi:hypothetical protein HPG69_001148 [Diceros bicornis minor]|uniref:Stabilin-2 n=1 Tax=Diceros bicornis minor TaxID=77932 RepID=A0A7J7FES6_DICBM|nr:hypothetical protein HPG69_001148 [Diceros bicornis minor]
MNDSEIFDSLECPGGAKSPCSGRGSCADGMEGNGSCSCQEGFGGTACETCADDNLFGPSCSAVCSCVHGVCNSGTGGDGTCECYSAYTGPNCDQPIPECAALLCPENSRCSPSNEDGTKLECKCLPNYKGDGKYCEPINPCLQDICHLHAHCTYLGPNRHSCTCKEGYRGDGQVCLPVDPCQTNFGNCPTKSTVCKYDGPGQVKELLMDNEAAQYFVKLHIIAGQMNTECMSNIDTFYTLTGKSGEIFNGDKDNQLKLKLYGGKKKVKIIEGNIIASNGLLHILDRAMDKMAPTFKSNTEQTIMTMLQPRYSTFRSLLEETNVGHALDEDGVGGPYTIFVPSNEALNNMKDGTLDYLLSPEGSRKLLELIRYHIVPFTQLEVATLVSTPHIRSMANQIIQFNTTNNGQLLANGVAMEEIEVAAKNGRIYTLTGVLVPPSIVPVLPRRCDETKREIKLALFTHKCVYTGRIRSLKSGCARYCNVTVKCVDGLGGNGTCVCQDGFQGSQCQFCSDPNKYGPQCDKKCLCVDGTCDNRIDSDGACLLGTCREGSAGRFCHRQTSACGPYVQFCHIHATCEYSNGTASCVCKAGYEGDGSLCSEMDPCAGSTLGGCSHNAECIRTGTGTHTCVCQQGWTGDGRDCSEINNCLLPLAGGCHDNATCLYVGPGQNECECKKGFRGNGIDCEPISSCLEQTGKCHPLATCEFTSGVWSCVCGEGYEGDGLLCYGNAAVELSFLSAAAIFNQWLNNASLQPMLSAASNLTVLVPSQQAIENMDQEEKAFWLSKSNIPALVRYHTLLGTYGVADLQALSSSDMLATSLQGNFLHLEKADGNITIEGASIVDGDNAATNGVIHIINKQYNLASAIEAADAYTVFAPNNDAIENYVREKKVTTLEEDILKYHVVLEEKLLKNDLHNGMHRETMLGFSYLVSFFLHDDQLYVNEAPINYTNVATDKGVIHGLGKVLEIQKNRCDNNDTTILRVSYIQSQ